MLQDCVILVNGMTCFFSQVLIRYVSLMGNALDFRMMCIVGYPGKGALDFSGWCPNDRSSIWLLISFEKDCRIKDISVERTIKDYHIKPRNKYESMDAGFTVDLEIPKGNTGADRSIREWMMTAVRDDAFFQLESSKDIPVGKCTSLRDMLHSLDDYGVLWEKLCRAEYQIEDTLEVRMTCDIKVKKVVDCQDYTTYYYRASLYNGGFHDLPREYYITYDKKKGVFVDVGNTVKPAMLQRFRHLVLESLKKEYDFNYERESSWEYLPIAYSPSIVLWLIQVVWMR